MRDGDNISTYVKRATNFMKVVQNANGLIHFLHSNVEQLGPSTFHVSF